jgi:hypothetical protein
VAAAIAAAVQAVQAAPEPEPLGPSPWRRRALLEGVATGGDSHRAAHAWRAAVARSA